MLSRAAIILTALSATSAFSPAALPALRSASRLAAFTPSPGPARVSPNRGLSTLRASVEDNLKAKGITIPERAPPAANYVPYLVTGKFVYISGQLPMMDGEIKYKGKVGTDVKLEDAVQSARLCGLNIIAQAKAAADGDLDKIKRVVKLVGFVNCGADFYDQPKVINGASDLMNEVFGEKGMHARSAVGTNALPFNVATEIEAVLELE